MTNKPLLSDEEILKAYHHNFEPHHVSSTTVETVAFDIGRHVRDFYEADRAKTCKWTHWDPIEYGPGTFSTACGNVHSFTEDSIAENRHVFCPYCGKRLEEGK